MAAVVVAIVAGSVVVFSHALWKSSTVAQGPPSHKPSGVLTSPTGFPSGGVAPGPGRPLAALFDPSQPLLPGGHTASLPEAVSLVDYPLFLPQDPNLPEPEVWVFRETTDTGPFYEAAVRYDASLVLIYARWSAGQDPAREYQKEASDWHAGYVTNIAGHPAWVVPGADNSLDSAVSVVHVSIKDVEVTLFGKIPLDAVLVDAASLTPA